MITIPGMPVPFYVPKCRTNIGRFSFQYKGPCFFNSLSPDVVSSVSVSILKKKSEETNSHLTVAFPPPSYCFTIIITLPFPLSLSNIYSSVVI